MKYLRGGTYTTPKYSKTAYNCQRFQLNKSFVVTIITSINDATHFFSYYKLFMRSTHAIVALVGHFMWFFIRKVKISENILLFGFFGWISQRRWDWTGIAWVELVFVLGFIAVEVRPRILVLLLLGVLLVWQHLCSGILNEVLPRSANIKPKNKNFWRFFIFEYPPNEIFFLNFVDFIFH